MELTQQNYHTLASRYLTNSRIGDWLKCKQFFKERHITGQRPGKQTEAMKIGSAVDLILSEGIDAFYAKYTVPVRRNLKNPPTDIIELTQSQYDDCLDMGKVMLAQPFYEEIKDYKKQEIITADMPIGEHFVGLSAIPDFYQIKDGICDIVDLKTAADADTRKYFYKCLDFGYFRQFAVMTIIFRGMGLGIKEFRYWHYVCEKNTNDSIFTPHLFRLANERVEWHCNEVMDLIIPDIAREKDFNPLTVSRKDAVLLGAIDSDE